MLTAQSTGFVDRSRIPDTDIPQNAGHIAQMCRPDSFHALTDTSSYHVLAIDYRGFGHSTGVPSEQGLITDAEALVEWAVNVARIPTSQIVLLGHSLGTAVASGVAERYALKGIDFAGVVLVAGFGDLASMISGYRISGLVPLMGPFAKVPGVAQLLGAFIVDKWHSANRLANIARHAKRLNLQILHAKDDSDIPCTESDKLFRSAALAVTNGESVQFDEFKAARTVATDEGSVSTVTVKKGVTIRQELIPYGGKYDFVPSAC